MRFWCTCVTRKPKPIVDFSWNHSLQHKMSTCVSPIFLLVQCEVGGANFDIGLCKRTVRHPSALVHLSDTVQDQEQAMIKPRTGPVSILKLSRIELNWNQLVTTEHTIHKVGLNPVVKPGMLHKRPFQCWYVYCFIVYYWANWQVRAKYKVVFYTFLHVSKPLTNAGLAEGSEPGPKQFMQLAI